MYSAYDRNRDPFEDEGEPEESLTCRRCGKDHGLYWLPSHTGRGFVMYDENGLHRCYKPATADDFDDITEPSFADMI